MQPRQIRMLRILTVATTVVVIFLSLGNPPQLTPGWFDFPHADKLKHALAYAVLGGLWTLSLPPTSERRILYIWLGLFLLGALLEVMQWKFYPARYFEYADMLANAVGAGFGCQAINRIFPS